MSSRAITGAVLVTLSLAASAPAADFSDPTWPCIQRKVEGLSPGIMWPHPIEERTFAPETEAAARDLAGRMALRRIAVEDLPPMVAEFTEAHGRDPALLGHVFMLAFDRMSSQRRAIMQGIEDYSLKQIALSQRIDATRVEMDRLMVAEQPDYDRVDELEEQLAWDERIFTDRTQSLTYVCETPVILEKRLYSIAQMLAAATGG
ncbi:hypothetical protein [Rhodovulum euryhalinum]|uniref:Uncharacterized protein n=1 Tax=Rhodovulum euryhalinum TaxID=35805 RepID=A0A4R2KNM0_9RHOB|nr:hypothetical protein [Rhodovulum euryhalinum]TCO71668.1 hypothetical protein EV655_106161 [Rhodovulum euryhalinum]